MANCQLEQQRLGHVRSEEPTPEGCYRKVPRHWFTNARFGALDKRKESHPATPPALSSAKRRSSSSKTSLRWGEGQGGRPYRHAANHQRNVLNAVDGRDFRATGSPGTFHLCSPADAAKLNSRRRRRERCDKCDADTYQRLSDTTAEFASDHTSGPAGRRACAPHVVPFKPSDHRSCAKERRNADRRLDASGPPTRRDRYSPLICAEVQGYPCRL
jgi:hypothetical protein